MNISDDGLELIKRFEGLRLHSYKCPAGVWTVGYGHTGDDCGEGLKITQERADEMLRADVRRFEEGVRKLAPVTTQGQFDALVSFAFNLGLGALKSSTLLRKHNAGDHAAAANEFGRWIKAGGRVLAGLMHRRADEAVLYRGHR